jgi:hypothetical protein
MNKKETIRRKNERNMKYEMRTQRIEVEALRRECYNNRRANHQMQPLETIYNDDSILPVNKRESDTLIWGSLP